MRWQLVKAFDRSCDRDLKITVILNREGNFKPYINLPLYHVLYVGF